MKSKTKEEHNTRDLIIKIVLIVIIIILLIHNCVLMKENNKYQNDPSPNGNVDIIDIKCDDVKCQKEIESVSFSNKKISILKDDSINLVLIVKPSELASSKFTWKSSNPRIVSVDENGKITGNSLGSATITVTSNNGKKATITVTVTGESIPVEKINLSPNETTIKVGSKTQIIAEIKPDNATNSELIFTSSDSSIATVDSKGVVKGIKPGTVTITAKTKDGKVVATSTITVEENKPTEITSINFTEDNVSVTEGKTLNLIVEIKPIEFSDDTLTYTSSDSSIVTVDSNGMIKGIKEGTATITVKTSNGKTATCTVTVKKEIIPVTSINVEPNKVETYIGGQKQVVATIEPENATERELIWESSNPSVATVDSNGIITGKSIGTTTITVKTKDGKVKATVTVEVDNDDDTDEFKVYDREKNPVNWNGATDLKIFTKSIYTMDGVIAPESSNTYEFDVKNSTAYSVKYNIEFKETNLYDINMKFKLRKNNTYIIDHYVSASELDITDQLLNSNNKDVYYLEWKWVSSSNDLSIGTNPDANYSLKIEVKAESIN